MLGGTAILATTRPVSVSASLTIESVPAEKRWVPLGREKARERQEPLWRWVDQVVLIVLMAGGAFFLEAAGGGGVGFVGEAGRRLSWTWPEARPRARRGEVGWMARAKRSEGRG